MAVTRSHIRVASSTTQQVPTEQIITPYLPPEVHRIIAQYMHPEDLPAYRLVSRLCASIGAEELFSSIAFHCSSTSVARIDAIKACEHLNKVVKSLVWDANFWSIPNVRDLHEWRNYFRGKAFITSKPMMVGDNFSTEELVQIAHCRHAWVDYINRVKDEKKMKRGPNIQKVLQGFQNLQKINILNGGLKRQHRGVRKCSDFVNLPALPASHYRGESLYNDGATVARLQRPGNYPFFIIQDFPDIDSHLTKLRLDAVCCSAFSRKVDRFPMLENLSSFHIRLTIRFEYHPGHNGTLDSSLHAHEISNHVRDAKDAFSNQHFSSFLRRLTKLESLKVEFDGPIYNENGTEESPLTVQDIVYKGHAWQHLRKLKLSQLSTTSAALVSLLESQQSTLRVLKLHGILLQPDYQTLQLERVQFSGRFGPDPTCKDEWWNFTIPSLAKSVEDFLIKGGSFPTNTTHG
ncbi:hypothetical protein DE146DRAFT_60498 [Phaeosphaeria sp. MPI-PUGE-AT-0046c]|nr:hypothetical protein DE146DRAFT_60498 [Phaeosphaeria sp. MPI-PUGE-AT-0046c]